MTNRRGDVIWHEPRGIAAGHPTPQVSIHRGRLQRILADAVLDRVRDRAIHIGHRLVAFHQYDDGVTARFVNRDDRSVGEATGDMLIGADGIHSMVRHLLRRRKDRHDGTARCCGVEPRHGRCSSTGAAWSSPVGCPASSSSTRSPPARRQPRG
jgi:2-polyprenyl-6-methoxyphenol hydroxylase-like FAD-dependent oxidoreductase